MLDNMSASQNKKENNIIITIQAEAIIKTNARQKQKP